MALRAITSFTAAVPGLGQPVVVRDAVFADDDPIVLAHPTMFETADASLNRGVPIPKSVKLPRKRASKRTEKRG